MTESHTAFTGSVPWNYDTYLGPALFEPHARELAARLELPDGASVLELACGTGILTSQLLARLPLSGTLVATDLNPAMMEVARAKVAAAAPVTFRQADAAELPFAPASFDAVVCQFGMMFVPERPRAFAEVARVLKPGAPFVFNTWGPVEENDFAHVAHTTITSFFPEDPPRFYEVPFTLRDPQEVVALLEGAGLGRVDWTRVSLPCSSPSAREAATGLVLGNPVGIAIQERGGADVDVIVQAVASALGACCGDHPVTGRSSALLFVARR